MNLKKYFYYTILVLTVGCSKENDIDQGNIDNFYSGADSSASIDKLEGVWAIVSAEFEGERTNVPINYPECGRDFFVYSDSGMYSEYIFPGSDCRPEINRLNWTLDRGVLTLSNSLGQTDDLVIMRLTNQEFVFKSRLDVDQDGQLDVLILTATRYIPEEIDFVSNTFTSNSDDNFDNLLSFTWDAYDGFNQFDKYEIYRSSGENCSKANAQLIATIEDQSITEYTDESPPVAENLCYFMRVYTDNGLLGESNYFISERPSIFIGIDAISLQEPMVGNNLITLNWEPSNSPYFSHYEITVGNYPGGSGPYGQQYPIATITDVNIVSFTDENPPYLENPIYTIYAYNIFGNRSSLGSDESKSYQEASFKRKEILPFERIISYAIDPVDPIVYLYGEESGERSQPAYICRFNYINQEIESISNSNPTSQTNIPIKVFESANGKEIIIKQGIELHFYNALTMEYKYAIDPEGAFTIDDFSYYPDLDVWIISDHNNVFTLKRDNANLFLIDTEQHFTNHQGGGRYEFIPLLNNQIVLGHPNESSSFVFTMDGEGNFIESQSVNLQFRALFRNERLLYNATSNLLLDTGQNRFYSSLSFQFDSSFEEPYFPLELNLDGTKVFGTNNDPDWNINSQSLHKKEAVILDRNTMTVTKQQTLGYPHVLFESRDGELISISSGFKKQNVYQSINNKADLFMERLKVP